MTIESEAARYINRELSWLQFNQRVLEQATEPDHALLDQAKFVAISSSNLDEFFMVRMGSLKWAADRGSSKADFSGLTAQGQLDAVRPVIHELIRRQYELLGTVLEPQLAERGIIRLTRQELMLERIPSLDEYFEDIIAAGLAPIAISQREQLPVLRGMRMGLLVRLRGSASANLVKPLPGAEGDAGVEADRFHLIPFTTAARLPRVVQLPAALGFRYALLEDVLATRLDRFFPGQEVVEAVPIRITRNADFELDEYSDDFMVEVLALISQRQASPCVRLEIAANASASTIAYLQQTLGAADESVYSINGPIDLTYLMGLAPGTRFAEWRDTPWPPIPSPDFPSGADVFDVVRQADRLLIHPYQDFEPVLQLLRAAAADPDVLAIKQTLYRTARNSKVVEALIDAKRNGKHVTVVVELKARFDEQRNVQWARRMEQEGIDVVYGVSGLKTHAKVCVIVRKDPDGVRRYVHFGTGNYNETTSTLYSDVSLLTCDEVLGRDAVHAFNAITGLSAPQPLAKLALAPVNLRETLVNLIRTEAINAQRGGRAGLTAKLNSLVDPGIIDELYTASQAGVSIRLNVRGICCLRPGIPGLSENIRVFSIIDRFLEHARILHVHHGGEDRVYISSADWMGRNLDRRVELLVPVEDAACRRRLLGALEIYGADNTHAFELRSDGRYVKIPRKRRKPLRAQRALYDESLRLNQERINPHGEVFLPIRGNVNE